MGRNRWFLPLASFLGFAFLYAPIISLVIFSFNANRLVTVWSGFSTQSYADLLADPQLLPAAWLSLQIAGIAATIALVLGTLCAIALVRFRRFRGKTILQATVSAPLVMPDVITGLALLLLFVAMQSVIGWPAGHGMLTIIIAHATFCTAYVTVVVQSRLSDFDLSLDDLVIASFVSGPGASTLPMVIFSKVKLGVSPEVNALATIIIGAVALGVVVFTFLQMGKPRAKKA